MKKLHTIACAVLLVATPAAAQFDDPAPRSGVAGFSVGLFFNGSSAALDGSDEVDAGPGGTLALGYGFNDNLTAFVRGTGASVKPAGSAEGDSYTLAHADLGLRYSFASSRSALRPFVQAAVSGRAASSDSEGTQDIRGTGFTPGVGLAYFVTPKLALEVALSYTVGEFSERRVGDGDWTDMNDALKVDSARFDWGLSLAPLTARFGYDAIRGHRTCGAPRSFRGPPAGAPRSSGREPNCLIRPHTAATVRRTASPPPSLRLEGR